MGKYTDLALMQIAQNRKAQQDILAKAQAEKEAKAMQPGISDYAKQLAATIGGRYAADKLGALYTQNVDPGVNDILGLGEGGSATTTTGEAPGMFSSAFKSVFPGQGDGAVSTGFLQESAPGVLLDTGDIIGVGEAIPEGATAIGSAPVEGLSSMGQGLSVLGAAHGLYGIGSNWGEGDWKGGAMSGAEAGAGIGSMIAPGPGTLIGAGIGAIGGGLLGAVHTGQTNEGTLARNDIRKFLADKGVSPEAGFLNMPDGSRFEMTSGGSGSGNYNVDQAAPLAGVAQGFANPLGEILTSGDPKYASQTAGWYANAGMQGATDEQGVLSNLRYQYKQAGINKDEAYRAMDRLISAGKITQQEYDAYTNALNQIYNE